jgi:hypothetical protein
MREPEKKTTEKLRIEKVAPASPARRCWFPTSTLLPTVFRQATRALEVEVAAAEQNQKAALSAALEDKVASATRARQKLMLINYINFGEAGEFGLYDNWPKVPRLRGR